MKKLLLLLTLLLAVRPDSLHAAIKLNGLFTDGLVLQTGQPVPVWGTASPGDVVTVEFAGQKKSATADAQGQWQVDLDALAISAESREMVVNSGADRVTLHDVLVGEVWLASGQSNMGSPVSSLHEAADLLAHADDAQLRFFTVTKRTAAEPRTDTLGKWEAAGPKTAGGFSAVAYYFARELRADRHCPVAIVHSSWGGTDIETWISLAGLQMDPPLTKPLQRWADALVQYHKVQADPGLEAAYQADLKAYQATVAPAYNEQLKQYNADKAAGKPVGPKPEPARPEPNNPDPMGMTSPSRRPSTPTVIFNGMIAPLVPFAVRGVIWYQGENNGGRGLEYRALLPRLIADWRRLWANPSLPFDYVQLPCNGSDTTPVATQGWPWLREAQLMALKVPGTAMAITIDVGDPKNVHPADKLDVGRRLGLVARRAVYGEKLVASGPLYQGFEVAGEVIRVHFAETGSGLTPGQAPWRAPGVEPLPTDHLMGFFIAGEDHKWVPAEAKIEGETVVVSSPAVPRPVAVRYGWANSPRCNLYNKEGLPASPFRTDEWEK